MTKFDIVSITQWKHGTKDSQLITTDKGNITYQWEMTNIVSQDEVHLPCKLKEDEDKETQIYQTLNAIKSLIQFT